MAYSLITYCRDSFLMTEGHIPSPELTRDSELWFADGNIVVISQRTAFRVHRSVLSRHSEAFSGLFTIPQPISTSSLDLVDGCPVVFVADSAHDFKHLLHILYDGLTYLKHDQQITFSTLAALARLGHKYELEDVVAGACGRLASVFSSDHQQWRATHGMSNAHVVLVATDAIEAFNLFRVLGRTDLLPAAMYACCQLPFSTLLRGVPRADGTLETLGVEDLERCLAAREGLATAYAWMSLTFLDVEPRKTCLQRAVCAKGIAEVRQGPVSGPDLCQGTDLLSQYFSWLVRDMEEDEVICRDCLGMLLDRHESMQAKIWQQLPIMMQLEGVEWPAATGLS